MLKDLQNRKGYYKVEFLNQSCLSPFIFIASEILGDYFKNIYIAGLTSFIKTLQSLHHAYYHRIESWNTSGWYEGPH